MPALSMSVKPGSVDLYPDWQSRLVSEITPTWESMGAASKDRARSIVPVRTGHLRDTIDYQVDRQGSTLVMTLYAGADYARFVEEGTSDTPAQPYLRPAALQAPKLV